MCLSLVSRHHTDTLAPFASSLCCAHRFIPRLELLKWMSTGIAMDCRLQNWLNCKTIKVPTTFTFAAFCKLSFSLCLLVSFHCLSIFAVAEKQMRHFKYLLMFTPCKSLLMLWGISAVYEPLDSWSIHPAGVCLIHHASMSDITHKNGTESGNDSLSDLLANVFCVAWHTWWFGWLLLLSHI